MRLEMTKLTKGQINEIVKSLPPKFAGIIPYDISHENKIAKNNEELGRTIIELYNKNSEEIFDKWGEYDIVKNRIFVMAWDNRCKWKVGVYLYEDHFEIPEYAHGVYESEIEKALPEYREMLQKKIKSNDYIYFRN